MTLTAFKSLVAALFSALWIPASFADETALNGRVGQSGAQSPLKKIYVGSFGTDTGAEIIRQKVINRLIKSGVVTIIECAESADATLTGAAEIDKRHYFVMSGNYVSSGNRYSAECVLRLISKDGRVLWTAENATRRFFLTPRSSRSAGSNVADKVVKELLQVMAPVENTPALAAH